jgi:predicted esterase
MRRRALVCVGIVWLITSAALAIESVPRVLPPAGIELPSAQRQRIEQRLREVLGHAQRHLEHPLLADAGALIKAVDFALRNGEFYQPKDADKALRILQLADDRLAQLAADKSDWKRQHGRVVRGFRSRIDDSFQPYGLVIPEDVDLEKSVPLYVWLHGRGDKLTDLHFIQDRLDKDGQIKPAGAIVLHPFGRHCLGFKSAGETDVLEAIEHVQSQYKIDPDRIVLIGFSMGGAGAWHLGAHYTDRFVAISPGAGFAETARYTNLKPENYPPAYEQKLWGVYDVPNYTRNLFNRPVIAYSGELDKQIQAARVMEEAYQEHGQKLMHLIGPGMGHQYHPDSLKDLLQRLKVVVDQLPRKPERVTLQTRTLRYNRMDWVEAVQLDRHWEDSRIDAEIVATRKIRIRTKNVAALKLSSWMQRLDRTQVEVDETEIEVDGLRIKVPPKTGESVTLIRHGKWQIREQSIDDTSLLKKHGLQGPIDDAFLEPFLVVTPAGKEPSTAVQEWIDFELAHFRDRWRQVFRGELRIKSAADVTPRDIEQFHLIVWGTPESNPLLKKALSALPLSWSSEAIAMGSQRYAAASHVPVFVYPNPLNPKRYLVVNSGPTFREAHDRTNSLQNPKLPDWAIVDITQPPDVNGPGRIVAADFFDEQWKVQ